MLERLECRAAGSELRVAGSGFGCWVFRGFRFGFRV